MKGQREDPQGVNAIIYACSRAEAIADGIIVDVSDVAKEVGLQIGVDLTASAWAACVTGENEREKLRELLTLLQRAVESCRDVDYVDFAVPVRAGNTNAKTLVTLRADSGPDDDWEAVITVMLPEEFER